MLPVPVKWCTICCLLTALIHIIVVAAITENSNYQQPKVSTSGSYLPMQSHEYICYYSLFGMCSLLACSISELTGLDSIPNT